MPVFCLPQERVKTAQATTYNQLCIHPAMHTISMMYTDHVAILRQNSPTFDWAL